MAGDSTAQSFVHPNQELLELGYRVPYKETSEGELEMVAFFPDGHTEEDRRGAVVFFYSSMWDRGLLSQFAPHCLHFREQGLVTFAADYRVAGRHKTGPLHTIADVRSALRWLRSNSAGLGLDPERICAVGAGASAHAILIASMWDDFDEPGENLEVPCVPDAMVLFEPVTDVTSKQTGGNHFPDKALAKQLSPVLQVRKEMPASLIVHGRLDRVIPYEHSQRLFKKMKRKRNDCELVEFADVGHGFYNFNVDVNYYEATLHRMDEFLARNGWISRNEVEADEWGWREDQDSSEEERP